MDRQAFNDALEEVWKVIRAANAYIDRQAPWALRKTDMARMGDVLRVLADVLRHVRHHAAALHAGQHGARCWTSWACRRKRGMWPLWRRRCRRAFCCRRRRACSRGLSKKRRNHLMLIDSHCHLDYFIGDEMDGVLARGAGRPAWARW